MQTVSLITQPYGFAGREFDPESGLYYYRARSYDPTVGRFLQSDPLGFAAGDTNLYAYTWNDPANWTDPSGLTGSGSYGRNAAAGVNMSRAATNKVGKSTLCLARRFATLLAEAGSVLVDDHFGQAAMVISQLPGCRTKVRAPCGCGGRGGKGNLLIKALAFAASNFSFPEGTEVLTPDGPVAIETLREGDLVVARNEETGVSGVFPVTAVMGRQASEVLWLTLENASGEVTRMGITPTHPLFIAGTGWGEAGALVAGDAIRDRDLQPMAVLAVEVDTRPQMVHNLEIAGAHTYFAGALEAWGHNGFGYYVLEFASGNFYVGKGCPKRMKRSIREKEKGYGDTLTDSKWYPADGNAASFIGEHLEMELLESCGLPTYNKIASPGKRLLRQILGP